MNNEKFFMNEKALRVYAELISTEESYKTSIDLLTEDVQKKILKSCPKKNREGDKSEKEIQVLFEKLNAIKVLQDKVLLALPKNYGEFNPSAFERALNELKKVYIDYNVEFSKTVSKNNPAVIDEYSETEKDNDNFPLRNHGLPCTLRDILISPPQRAMRYNMLLTELAKHVEVGSLENTIKVATEFADDMNAAVKLDSAKREYDSILHESEKMAERVKKKHKGYNKVKYITSPEFFSKILRVQDDIKDLKGAEDLRSMISVNFSLDAKNKSAQWLTDAQENQLLFKKVITEDKIKNLNAAVLKEADNFDSFNETRKNLELYQRFARDQKISTANISKFYEKNKVHVAELKRRQQSARGNIAKMNRGFFKLKLKNLSVDQLNIFKQNLELISEFPSVKYLDNKKILENVNKEISSRANEKTEKPDVSTDFSTDVSKIYSQPPLIIRKLTEAKPQQSKKDLQEPSKKPTNKNS